MEDIGDYHDRAFALMPWHMAFKLLSLDCWLHFWGNMGVSLEREQQLLVRDAARRAYRVLHGRDRTCYDGDYSPENTAATRDRFLEKLATQIGHDFADKIPHWVQRTCNSQYLGARLDSGWFGTLCYICHAERKPDEIGDAQWHILRGLIRNGLMVPHGQTHKQTSMVQTTSEWDLKLRKAQFDPKYPDCDEVPCRATVNLAASSIRLQRLWRHITETCSESEIATLHGWYRHREQTVLKYWPELDRLPVLD